MDGREDEMGPNALGPDSTPGGMQPPNISQGAHHFYSELLQGLDPSLAATIENQLPPMWGTYPEGQGLAAEAPLNLGTYSNWGAYAYANRDFTFPGAGGYGNAYTELTPPNLVNPLNQAENLASTGSESGFFNSFSTSSEGPPSPGLDFTAASGEGQQLYSEAMSHWQHCPQQPPQTVINSQNTRSYDLFGTPDVFHEPESAGQPVGHVVNPVPAPTPPCPVAPTPPPTSPVTVSNTKPSYSDVTKHKPPVGKCKTKVRSRANSAHSLKDEHITNAANTLGNHSTKSSSHRKGRNNRSSLRTKSVPLEPKTIQPNSRYGLDTFEEPPKGGAKSKDLCSKSSQSSDSLPQSRKGSTSSVGSSVSGIDEVTLLNKAYDAGCKTPDEMSKPEPVSPPPAAPGTPTLGAAVPKQEASKSDCTAPEPPTAKQTVKKGAFFDPKRIFAKAEGKVQNKQTDYVPNNQQAKQPSPDPLLNNGKPKSNLTSSINRSCYINNDLRDSRKQTNAKSAQTQTTPSHSRNNGGQGHAAKESHAPSGQGGGAGTAQQATNTQPQPKPAPNQRRKVNTGPERKRKEEAPPPKPKRAKRDVEPSVGGKHLLSIWLQTGWKWTTWGCLELFFILWNITKLVLSLGLLMVLLFGQYFLLVCKKTWAFLCHHIPVLQRHGARGQEEGAGGKERPAGLKENITLPTTGEEAMKRLLACRGKDPYSILGVKADATDEEVKKYYRKQAVLVHPDKNQQLGAEEAFKILGHAFELIGDPAKRGTYDAKRCENDQAETAMQEFADLLTKLHDKLQEAANLMRCENCGGKHRRVPTDRPVYAARFCDRCNIRHPAKEGDVWAESRMLGFLWHYYACMDSKVYDITEWASCQSEHFKRIQANAHHVIYRISTNSSRQRQNCNRSNNEADLEDFLSHLFHQPGAKAGSGAAAEGGEGFSYAGPQPPHAKWAGPQGSTAATGAAKKAKCRRKKARH